MLQSDWSVRVQYQAILHCLESYCTPEQKELNAHV